MDFPKLISTRDVPQQFLKSAFLAGHVPYKALTSDSRVSYRLYIPPEHINANPSTIDQKLPLAVVIHGTRPSDRAKEPELPILPLLVVIHGTGRTSDTLNALAPWSHSHPCAILAPLFPGGLDGPNDLDSYKTLSSETLRSDLALLSILDEVSQRWPGIATDKIFLVGFSGGGQFAQRFFYLYPERLYAVSIGAPGHMTRLDETLAWPQGIKDVQEKFSRSMSVERLQAVKNIQFVVGEEDNAVHGGGEFWKWLEEMKKERGGKKGDEKDGQLGLMRAGRLQMAKEMVEEWRGVGIEVQFDVVPGVAHNSSGVLDVVKSFLEPLIVRVYNEKSILEE